MKTTTKSRMIRGGRALAAALAGARLYFRGDGLRVTLTKNVAGFCRLYDANSPKARLYSVRADEAKEVLG
jgi:hypothetical protein